MTEFEININNRIYQGIIVERTEATEIYERAKSLGQTTSMIKHVKTDPERHMTQ